MEKRHFSLVVVGSSAGGLKALQKVLCGLPRNFPLPTVVVQHLLPASRTLLPDLLARHCELNVKEAEDKESLKPGTIYIAPASYHLFVERGLTLALSQDEKVSFARPSIDVLFESASEAVGAGLIGIVLTGANADGARGAKKAKERGAEIIVQAPETAEVPAMPEAVIRLAQPQQVVPLDNISTLLLRMTKEIVPDSTSSHP